MHFDRVKLEWLEFDLLAPFTHVTQGVFLRHGGVSEGHYATLNLGAQTADHPDRFRKNRELVKEAIDVDELVFPSQVHGKKVVRVTSKNCTKTIEADALFTTEKRIALGVTHADCQAAIFFDPANEAVGVVHAGWRGLVQNIYQSMMRAMENELGSKPQEMIVCISPSLGPDHAEFKDYEKDFPDSFLEDLVSPNHFNLWQIAKKQLLALGILEKNIEIAEVCTVCNSKDYFSYRREKASGRNGTIVALKE